MSSTIKSLILAFVMISSFTFAESPTSFAVVTSANKSTFKVFYKSETAGKVRVAIYNSTNTLVFDEVIAEAKSFIRPYNFSQLAEGEYTIVIEDKNGKQVERVSYYMEKVVSVFNISKVENTNGKYLLSVSNNGEENVNVRILDNTGSVLHTQNVTVKGAFNIVYNLTQIKASEVTFEVSSNGNVKTFTY